MNKLRDLTNIIMSFVRQYWKYKFRDLGMSFATLLITSGASLLLLGGAWKLLIELGWLGVQSDITFSANDYSGISTLLIIAGIAVGILRLVDIGKQLSGILIIHRGMEGMDTNSIQKALPKSFSKGKLDIIDLQEGHQLYEGKVVHPERALEVINGLNQQIKTRLNGRNISEVKLAFGGLAPIPLLVAAGYKVTSRQECITLDYSRLGSWHGLDDIDDLEEVSIIQPDCKIIDQVAIMLPFSVEISEKQLPQNLSDKAYIVRLKKGARPDSLNSTDKQKRIASELYTLCANLKAEHPALNEIHLFLASQASFAFRLGTMLTASVLPKVSIYQYDSGTGKYGWGVSIIAGKALVIADAAT